MEKNINCPLCHSVGVINVIKPEMTISPAPPSLSPHVGNYHREVFIETFDLSHAENCPKLVNTFSPKPLLNSYLVYPFWLESDTKSYKDYKNAFERFDIKIVIKKDKGKYVCFLSPQKMSSDIRYNEAFAEDKEKAFLLLKHRLLCGEIVMVLGGPLQKTKDKKNLEFCFL